MREAVKKPPGHQDQAAFSRPRTPRRAAPEGAERASEDKHTTAARKSQARRAKLPPGEVKAGGEHRIGAAAASAAPAEWQP